MIYDYNKIPLFIQVCIHKYGYIYFKDYLFFIYENVYNLL